MKRMMQITYDNYTLDSNGTGDLLHLSCAPTKITVNGKNVNVKVDFVGWDTVDLPYGGRLNMIDKFPPFQDYRVEKVAVFRLLNGPSIVHKWYISHFKHLWRVVSPKCNNELDGYDPEISKEAYRLWLAHKTIPSEIEEACRKERIEYGHGESIIKKVYSAIKD